MIAVLEDEAHALQMLDVLLGPRKEVIETDHLFIFIFRKEEVTRE